MLGSLAAKKLELAQINHKRCYLYALGIDNESLFEMLFQHSAKPKKNNKTIC